MCTFIFASSCTGDKKLNNEAVRKEIENRKIKKITEAEIMTKVHEIGHSIALETKKTLSKNLRAALGHGGIEHAIGFCNLNAMPLIDSLNRVFDAEIRRVTLKARNPDDLPDPVEKKILEAYAYQWQDSVPLSSNVQPVDENYLFTKPILIDNALCLSCHGVLGEGLTEATNGIIKSKYPADRATGYRIGDFRGMWSILLSKKKVVQAM
ncbi:MAG: DUF3365 domain-containing protein [Cytophagales bacterium]|nr:DUF3365 domain-containing protein [Cytophagales bacterium]